jgi:hypothetical protein
MTNNKHEFPPTQEETLRAQLEMLRARYDSSATPLGVYVIIKTLECELAWRTYEQAKGAVA